MQQVLDLLEQYYLFIIGIMAVLMIIMFILIIIQFASLSKVEKRYKKLMRGMSSRNLEDLVNSYLDKVDESVRIAEDAKDATKDLAKQMKKCAQKISVIRYKAFEDVGSDLSFSIALLDDNNDGVILTGIYARYESTTYAKPIDKGISRYDLSEEEKHVLKDAMSK